MHVHRLGGFLGLTDARTLTDAARPDLSYPAFVPAIPADLVRDADGLVDMLASLDEHDLLVHHPYDSFQGTVQAFIEQAAADPKRPRHQDDRVSDIGGEPDRRRVGGCRPGGEAGRRPDRDQGALRRDRQHRVGSPAQEAGCHVVYGLIGLKTHCKLALVVRREPDGLRPTSMSGPATTTPPPRGCTRTSGCSRPIRSSTAGVSGLFNLLTGYARQAAVESMMIAPFDMRPRLLALIRQQAKLAAAGKAAHITMKMNSLVDQEVVEALYDGVGGRRPDRPRRARDLRPAAGRTGNERPDPRASASSAASSSTRGSIASGPMAMTRPGSAART